MDKYTMTRQLFCVKLKQQADAMDVQPFPGDLGVRIFNEVSKQGWKMWLAHQTMLINENRLSLIDPKAREYLREEMQNYFFGDGSKEPDGFTPLT